MNHNTSPVWAAPYASQHQPTLPSFIVTGCSPETCDMNGFTTYSVVRRYIDAYENWHHPLMYPAGIYMLRFMTH